MSKKWAYVYFGPTQQWQIVQLLLPVLIFFFVWGCTAGCRLRFNNAGERKNVLTFLQACKARGSLLWQPSAQPQWREEAEGESVDVKEMKLYSVNY